MKTVWKYPVPIADDFELAMPKGARPLCVQVQQDEPQLWALVTPGQVGEIRHFRLTGTGHPLEYDPEQFLVHIDTFQVKGGALVFHVFEVLPRERYGQGEAR